MALAWFVDQPEPAYAARVRARFAHGAVAVVPAIWHLEIANGLSLAQRKGLLGPPETAQHLQDLEQLLPLGIETDSKMLTIREIFETALSTHLIAYDAVYLLTAKRTGLPLATLDRTLQRVAEKEGVTLLD